MAGGYLVPLALVAIVLASAAAGRALRRLLWISLLLTFPIAVSVILVSVLTRPGDTVLLVLGPFDITLEGVDFAGQTLLRLFAISTAIGLFTLTTDPRAFVFDMERRGLSPRLAFVAAATIEAVPAMVARAGVIAAAQRSRGLDTEGSLRARLRGVLPIVAPVLLSSLTEVEERSLALEVRGFGRPGRRHLLWWPPDRPVERLVRWLLVAAFAAVVAVRVLGAWPPIP